MLPPKKKRIAILGATGSIGQQALEVVRAHSDRFEVSLLSARSQEQLLYEASLEFGPQALLVEEESARKRLKNRLHPRGPKVYSTDDFAELVYELPIDLVIVAVVGFAGLAPTLSAIEAGKPIALANKESLVAGGSLVMEAARSKGVPIYPIDSEHSAIFQCLVGEEKTSIKKLILTASGGPFWEMPSDQMSKIRPSEALRHPTWTMGPKVTVDSATMMNKGLEIIEAYWLFGVPLAQIEVLVHRQSWVHSLVEFVDGSQKAQLGPSDMRLPIQFAMSYPERLPLQLKPFLLSAMQDLSFEAPDEERFPSIRLAREALSTGGNIPCALNAANECAVAAFLEERLPFTEIMPLIASCLEKISYTSHPNYAYIQSTDTQSRVITEQLIHSR